MVCGWLMRLRSTVTDSINPLLGLSDANSIELTCNSASQQYGNDKVAYPHPSCTSHSCQVYFVENTLTRYYT